MKTTLCRFCKAQIQFINDRPCETELVAGCDLEDDNKGLITRDGEHIRRPADDDEGYEPHSVYCKRQLDKIV